MFRVGQKVVCVVEWSEPVVPGSYSDFPRKGCVYTIRELLHVGSEPSLRLCEIVNPPSFYCNIAYHIEAGWVLWAFRPVVETDISIFTKMLTPKKRRADADASA